MVTHSTFHIWFGFSYTPKIKVITAVCTRKRRGQCLAEEHFLSVVLLFLWLSLGAWVKTHVVTLIIGVQEKQTRYDN